MANSSLATYTRISPHNSGTRTSTISKITIHHMSGKMTAKACADYFATTDREVSSNYCIGYDGSIAVSVNESDRSWCSSSRSNDQAAVTIEVSNIANSGDPDWKVSDAAMASLIKLCADVCKRNGIKKLYYDGTTNATLTRHCMFASTDCPGPYLKSKTTYICDEVNKLINATTTTDKAKTENKSTTSTTTKNTANTTTNTTKKTTTTTLKYKKGDIVKFEGGMHYSSSSATTGTKKCTAGKAKVTSTSAKAKHPYHLVAEENGGSNVYGWVDANTISGLYTATFTPYKVKIIVNELIIREGAGTNYKATGKITDCGIYTIIGESKGAGASKWGKLKSGAGWISLGGTKKV